MKKLVAVVLMGAAVAVSGLAFAKSDSVRHANCGRAFERCMNQAVSSTMGFKLGVKTSRCALTSFKCRCDMGLARKGCKYMRAY